MKTRTGHKIYVIIGEKCTSKKSHPNQNSAAYEECVSNDVFLILEEQICKGDRLPSICYAPEKFLLLPSDEITGGKQEKPPQKLAKRKCFKTMCLAFYAVNGNPCGCFVLGYEILPYPPYSTELAPNNFSLFLRTNNPLRSSGFPDDDAVKLPQQSEGLQPGSPSRHLWWENVWCICGKSGISPTLIAAAVLL